MSDRILVGTHKGLFDLRRKREKWTVARRHFMGNPVSAVMHDPGSRYFLAALALGHFGVKLWRSDNDAKTWREVAAPAYPAKPADSKDKNDWSTKLLWVLEPGGKPGLAWAGTLPGGLFKSTDSGKTWTLVRSLWDMPERLEWMGGGADHPGIHSISIHPKNPDDILIGVSTGGVWRSQDGGESWRVSAKGMFAAYMPPARKYDEVAQDAHRIVRCAAAPDVLWCQHHNGIFRSTDGAKTWKEMKARPSSFGFAVSAHPSDPKTAWFVPARSDEVRIPVDGKLVVTRTRDGGKSTTEAVEGSAADGVLRPHVPPRPRCRRRGQAAGVRHDQRWRVDLARRRSLLDCARRAPAAGAVSEVRVTAIRPPCTGS